MSKVNLTTVAFKGTAEQEAQLRAELKEIAKLPGSLMPALQTAQNIYGYLPIEVQTMVAEELGVSLEEVFGVATFYSQFVLNLSGKFNSSWVPLDLKCGGFFKLQFVGQLPEM